MGSNSSISSNINSSSDCTVSNGNSDGSYSSSSSVSLRAHPPFSYLLLFSPLLSSCDFKEEEGQEQEQEQEDVDDNAFQPHFPLIPLRLSRQVLLLLPNSKAEQVVGQWEDGAAVVGVLASYPPLLPPPRCACQPYP